MNHIIYKIHTPADDRAAFIKLLYAGQRDMLLAELDREVARLDIIIEYLAFEVTALDRWEDDGGACGSVGGDRDRS